ncbi:pirin family protein [Paludibacterium denitrificans]|uniref:pirin family protein n=1 Tax=Paludibacterium denitrificans TaxID=2675226 RepID=UPI001E64D278|nr:pirin family protein [Paludibacterium denitrificans]
MTYLFSGALLHRDSLGSVQRIEPGAVNLMTAGRGIVHSERIPQDIRKGGLAVEGIQMWLALPTALEECESFPACRSGNAAATATGRCDAAAADGR